MNKLDLWNHGLDRGQEEFGALPIEVVRAAYAEYLACHEALQNDTSIEEFKTLCRAWWRKLKREFERRAAA